MEIRHSNLYMPAYSTLLQVQKNINKVGRAIFPLQNQIYLKSQSLPRITLVHDYFT